MRLEVSTPSYDPEYPNQSATRSPFRLCQDSLQCTNNVGSFTCGCPNGYKIVGNSCIDIDECHSLENVCNGGECRNTPGGFSCICSGGLMMGPDASSCLDLDECIIEPDVSDPQKILNLN